MRPAGYVKWKCPKCGCMSEPVMCKSTITYPYVKVTVSMFFMNPSYAEVCKGCFKVTTDAQRPDL